MKVALLALALLLAAASLPALVRGNALDDYVSKPESVYKWAKTNGTFKTSLGGTAYVLNVTSQTWLDTSKAAGPNGAVWSHQVIVIVPKKHTHTNFSVAYATGNCNSHPTVPGKTDEEVLLIDTVTHDTGVMGIIVYQIPNCPIVYPSDPRHKGRGEDDMIAWAWKEYLDDPKQNPEWLPRLPMAKGVMQSMRAVQEFTKQENIAAVEGWLVAGASKRGWTTWMVGAVTCPSCVNILAIAPLVPIVPSIRECIHRMYRSYDGFTFAFEPYQADGINLTQYVDSAKFDGLVQTVDPINYKDRLSRIPKAVMVSSDDEFMMFDQTNIWYDEMIDWGETHLLIAPNSEHSLATGVPEVVETLSTMVASLAVGQTTRDRPSFSYTRDNTTGAITVESAPGPAERQPVSVTMRYAETLQSARRDFRWVRLASNESTPCKLPDITLPKPIFGANCFVPIVWKTTELSESGGKYTAVPPGAKEGTKEGHWTGYYVEVKYASGTSALTKFHFTTPGFTWPDTLPFPDCHGTDCQGPLV